MHSRLTTALDGTKQSPPHCAALALARGAAAAAMAVAFVAACATKNDAISQAEKGEKNAPGAMETKAIAEEAYIYGCPMIAAYKAMWEFNIDKSSGQFKAGFNEIWNDAQVFTPKDTAIVTPNSDTPYSLVQ